MVIIFARCISQKNVRVCGKNEPPLVRLAVSSGQAGSGVNFGPNVSLGNCNVQ